VVALSGEPASFLAGGEFAVPSTVGLNGVGVATTTFRGFGTSLISTSTLVDRDLIRMEIIPELSELDQGAAVGGVPGVNVRRVQTRVELREGQTIVLGGVFSRRQRAEVTRIPVLGEIPIVGTYLFNTKQATEDETEMLIVLTPEIVRPMDPEEVPPLPGWYMTHPDDFDLCKFNRIEGNPDLGHYQLLPFGNGQGYAQDAGFNFHNPAPVDAQISPMATGPGYAPPAYPAPGYPAQTYPPQSYPPQAYPQGTAPGYGAPVQPAPPATLPELQPTPAGPQGPQVQRQGSRGGVQQASGTSPPRRSWFSRR
jgi:pilus assembly protein CpaC